MGRLYWAALATLLLGIASLFVPPQESGPLIWEMTPQYPVYGVQALGALMLLASGAILLYLNYAALDWRRRPPCRGGRRRRRTDKGERRL